MTFVGPFMNGGRRDRPGQAATWVAFAGAGLALVFNLVLALGILPASERREREIPLELASVAGGTAPFRLSAREVVVHVNAGGAVRLGGREVDDAALEAQLAKLVDKGGEGGEGGETALTLRADASAPHGAVARILAAARKAGIRDAAILTVDMVSGSAPLK